MVVLIRLNYRAYSLHFVISSLMRIRTQITWPKRHIYQPFVSAVMHIWQEECFKYQVRRRRDSNPWNVVSARWFSRPVQSSNSATPPNQDRQFDLHDYPRISPRYASLCLQQTVLYARRVNAMRQPRPPSSAHSCDVFFHLYIDYILFVPQRYEQNITYPNKFG